MATLNFLLRIVQLSVLLLFLICREFWGLVLTRPRNSIFFTRAIIMRKQQLISNPTWIEKKATLLVNCRRLPDEITGKTKGKQKTKQKNVGNWAGSKLECESNEEQKKRKEKKDTEFNPFEGPCSVCNALPEVFTGYKPKRWELNNT
jgi:hypothetical protein